MKVILGREERWWALTLEEVGGSRDWGSGLHGLELDQHGEAVDNPTYGGSGSNQCWQSSSPWLLAVFATEPGSHVTPWLFHEHLPLTATSIWLAEHLVEVMPSHVLKFCWTPSKLSQVNTPLFNDTGLMTSPWNENRAFGIQINHAGYVKSKACSIHIQDFPGQW